MALYITGDTHGGLDVRKLESKRFPEGKKLTKNDYVAIMGDFGLWQNKRSYDFIFWLDNKPFTTIFVEGNHEDYNFLKTFPVVEKFGGKVRKITDSVFQLMRGEIYNIDGYKIFAFGGARSVDRFTACRQENVDWFPAEESNYEEECYGLEQLKKHNYSVDLIFSHTCAKSTLDEIGEIFNIELYDYDSQNRFLEEVKNTVNYSLHCFGHMHKDIRINKKEIAVYEKVFNIKDLLK